MSCAEAVLDHVFRLMLTGTFVLGIVVFLGVLTQMLAMNRAGKRHPEEPWKRVRIWRNNRIPGFSRTRLIGNTLAGVSGLFVIPLGLALLVKAWESPITENVLPTVFAPMMLLPFVLLIPAGVGAFRLRKLGKWSLALTDPPGRIGAEISGTLSVHFTSSPPPFVPPPYVL